MHVDNTYQLLLSFSIRHINLEIITINTKHI